MNCCSPSQPIGRFFSKFAKRTVKKFRKKGLEKEQKRLMDCLNQVGYKDMTVLEIGCGVGSFHLSMIHSGAAKAVGVDISDRMLDQARDLAKEQGHADHTQYHLGDFTEISEEIEKADVTVLDKVVCCYPDPEALIQRSTAKTGKIYALNYPQDNWIMRTMFGMFASFLWIIRSGFRPYVHNPNRIQAWIQKGGFSMVHEKKSVMWLSQVYVRS